MYEVVTYILVSTAEILFLFLLQQHTNHNRETHVSLISLYVWNWSRVKVGERRVEMETVKVGEKKNKKKREKVTQYFFSR